MALTLLFSSDLHMGRRTSGVPDTSSQTSAALTWDRIVNTSVARSVDAVLLAGDIIDQENYFFESVGALVQGFHTLSENGIPVFLVAGNHDYDVLRDAVQQADSNWIRLLGADGKWEIDHLNSENSKLQVVGRSFTDRTQTSDPLTYFPQESINTDIPSVGLVHGEVDVTKSNYGPLNRDRLIATRLDAWVIGHIHKPGILRPENPVICYPGSPHAFSASEPGKHGPWLMHVKPDRSIETEQLSHSPVRFETIKVNVSELQEKTEFRNQVRTRLTEYVKHHEDELDKVYYLIFDLLMIGSVSNPRMMQEWGKEVTDYQESISGMELVISVRKIKTNFTTALEGLAEWSQEHNPAGILADMLLKLRENKSNELIDDLVEQWKIEMDRLNRSEVFRPLLHEDRQVASNNQKAREHLKEECEKLLLQLMQQHEKREDH